MAPRRGARSTKSVNNTNYSKISLDDALCPVCRCILIRPVSLPCTHDFCQPCFDGAVADASYSCPLCSARFGSWHRGAKKDNRVVNTKLWDALQLQFPQQVQDRLRDSLDEPQTDSHLISSPPEIKIDKNVHSKKHSELNTQKKKTSNTNNVKKRDKFIKCVEIEKLQLDEQVARQIATEMGFGLKADVKVDRRRRAQKVECQPKELPLKEKNAKQKNLMNFTSDLTDSNDSIENECMFFKPIDHRNIPPSRNGKILKVPAISKAVAARVLGSPNGIVNFTHSYNISAFAQFTITSPIEQLKVKAPKSRKRKSSGLGARTEINLMETEVVHKSCVKNLKSPRKTVPAIEVPKQRPSIREQPAGKMRLRDRKHSGSPLYGFAASELETPRKPTGHQIEQEKSDLEFAKRLQQEYNKERYSTRSSITCGNNIRRIKEMAHPSKCK